MTGARHSLRNTRFSCCVHSCLNPPRIATDKLAITLPINLKSTAKNPRMPVSERLKNLSNAQWVYLAFALAIIMMAGIAAIRNHQLDLTSRQIEQVVNDRLVKIRNAAVMRYAARERILGLHRMILSGDAFNRDEEWLLFNRYGGEFARARLKILSMPLSQQEHEMLELQGELTKQALDFQNRVIELIEKGQMDTARSVLQRAAIPAQNRVLDQLSAFYDYQETQADMARRQLHESYQNTQWVLVIATSLFIVVCILLAFFVARRSHQREQALQQKIDDARQNSFGQSQLFGKSGLVFSEQVSDLQQHIFQAIETARSHSQFNKHVQVHTSAAQAKAGYIGNLSRLLIELARLETGSEPLQFRQIDVFALVQAVVEELKPFTLRNNNSLNVQCSENIGTMVTDATRLHAMLLGLLQNTCSITEYGILTFTVSRDKQHLEFRIEDTGNGWNANRLRDLLQGFDSNDEKQDSKTHLYGLTLSLERRICRLLHGDLRLISEENIGITCIIRLPIHTPVRAED